jgi:hypothetical protein
MVKRCRCFSLVILFLLVGLSAKASAEMWLCSLPTGSAIYTNTPKDYQDCAAFEPKSDVPVFTTNRVPLSPRLEGFELPLEPKPGPRAEEAPPSREMPFEIFRMLSIGMNEAEVIARAGPPTYISSLPLAGGFGLIAPVSNALRYNYLGDWIVVVTFDLSGRVINLERFRPRP